MDTVDRGRVRAALTLRDWTDPRGGRHWKVRQAGRPAVLVFESEGEVVKVLVDFSDGLEDRSDGELQWLLDKARGW